jgi:Leu/Phe-tRNA-protein transferase
MVLFLDEFKVTRSLAKTLRRLRGDARCRVLTTSESRLRR